MQKRERQESGLTWASCAHKETQNVGPAKEGLQKPAFNVSPETQISTRGIALISSSE